MPTRVLLRCYLNMRYVQCKLEYGHTNIEVATGDMGQLMLITHHHVQSTPQIIARVSLRCYGKMKYVQCKLEYGHKNTDNMPTGDSPGIN